MKKALSILLSGILLMAVITAIPFTASAATDRVIDLSKSELLVADDNTNMVYDAEGAILKLSIQQWYGANKPISAVGDTSTWCKEIGLKYADGNWAWLESGKRYAVTLNYKILNNNGNGSDTQHLPQIAIGYDDNGSTTSKGAFYVAAVKNHKRADKGNSYYLNAEIAVEKDKPLRIGFSGAWQFQINSILLQEIDATAENQVTVVYCDDGEYKAEFATEGGALKVPVKENMVFGGWYSAPDFSGEKVTAATAGAVLYAKWIDLAKSDLKIDLSKSELLITSDSTAMKYDNGKLELSAQQYYWDTKPIGAVGSKSTWCKEIGLKYEDGTLAQLKSSKKYAVTLNYTFVNNNGNNQDARNLPQIAIGYDGNGTSTSKGAFYVAAVKNHAKADAGSGYYLTAEIEGNGKPLRIGFTGVVKFEINSILLQEIDANAENQVTVVYCDGGEYKAEFAAEGEALKTPVKDGKKFVGWYSASDYSGEKVTLATAGAVLYAKWIDLIKGDLNEDGAVDIIDLVILKKASVNLNTDLKYDLDGDSQPANAGDLSFLRRLLLGIIG